MQDYYYFTFIVLTIIVHVFVLWYVVQKSISLEKCWTKSGKGLEIYIQNCIGTLSSTSQPVGCKHIAGGLQNIQNVTIFWCLTKTFLEN